MTTNRLIQFRCPNSPTSKNARVGHFLTVTSNQYAHLIVAYTTIFRFAAMFTWLAFGDISLAFFRVQKVSLIHLNSILKCFGWKLF
ncbi:hypothetical protein SK3146_06835 [Paenibacillus konkukensis]|uniref:Uncharacterized protein n=1 Tax=Paenibacillus konkukensis TaxID=2020716 RepID=A0ABY4S082_9BACL|nr:hypothetical protein SK3146_06835 [Paenibacillus konkukensis]